MPFTIAAAKQRRTLKPSTASILDDGRVQITASDRSHTFQKGFEKFRRQRDRLCQFQDVKPAAANNEKEKSSEKVKRPACFNLKPDFKHFEAPFYQDEGRPRMNIAILVTGSRGDVQPFIALGQVLRDAPYYHRVRICTHTVFRDFVEENGLGFYSIGGDPVSLMAYMVKNPGVIPSLASVKAGDIGKRKAEIAEMLQGSWRACIESGNGLDDDGRCENVLPFVADAIIANPPSYAHIHIAEKLGIPLHIIFTMPWSPTEAFAHPLANLDPGNIEPRLANYFSYFRMDLLTWEGLTDVINGFREKTLMLDAISPLWGHRLISSLEVPHTYCWSEALIPKPPDWGPHISISGFFFLSLASSFQPSPELQAFLDAGPKPVYIGFGSIVVDDPEKLTAIIFEAVQKSGVRALVSKGWGNLGGNNPPPNIFLLDNTPHDWLFPCVSAVIHHGGAGTTAIGLALGIPTIIVPFFGDQPFWGNMVYRAGAGPMPIPYKRLSADRLAESITQALSPDVRQKAAELAKKIQGEDGPRKAAELFHSTHQMSNMACFLCPDRVAVWRVRHTDLRLSSLAAAFLVKSGKLKPDHLKLLRHKRWAVSESASGPLTAVVTALSGTAIGMVADLQHFGQEWSQASQKKPASSRSSTRMTPSIHESRTPANTAAGMSSKPRIEVNRPGSKNKIRVHAMGGLALSLIEHAARFPVSLSYNLANGFHNAPAIYPPSDPLHRAVPPIDSLYTGVRAGGREFALGLYDAFSGIILQPYVGYQMARAQKSGRTKGTIDGIARGMIGLIFKTGAAVLGPIGFTLKGLERGIQRKVGGVNDYQNVTAALEKARQRFIAAELKYRGGGGEVASDDDDDDLSRIPTGLRDLAGEYDLGPFEELSRPRGKLGRKIADERIFAGLIEYTQLKKERGDAEFEKLGRKILDRWDKLMMMTMVMGGDGDSEEK